MFYYWESSQLYYDFQNLFRKILCTAGCTFLAKRKILLSLATQSPRACAARNLDESLHSQICALNWCTEGIKNAFLVHIFCEFIEPPVLCTRAVQRTVHNLLRIFVNEILRKWVAVGVESNCFLHKVSVHLLIIKAN